MALAPTALPSLGLTRAMKYRSDVRESQLRNLRQKVEDLDYGRYLVEMNLVKLRAFRSTRLRFRFPVTALIGPNGGGKSTILGAAALPYKSIKPSLFFPMSSADVEAMRDLKVTYTLVDRKERADGTLERSATHPKKKWERSAIERKLLYFPMRRTIPATEKSEFTKFRTGVKELSENDYVNLGPDVIEPASRILGIDLTNYERATSKKPLIGWSEGVKHSEFHFGAGISVIVEAIWNLESLSPADQALILIEEVETTLHPHAVRRFVEYLIGVAERKRCQVIFTTHSEYALDPLPREAIWGCRDGRLVNGRLRVEDMLAFRGDADTRLVVFCEDKMAVAWVQGMLRFDGMGEELATIEFFAVGGHGDVRAKTLAHNADPARKLPAIAFIDGDAPADLPEQPETFRLPGTLMPEEVILDSVRESYSTNLALLTVALTRRPEEQDLVRKVIDTEARDTEDMHLVFNKIGIKLGFVPEETVRGAMITAYCQSQPEESRRVSEILRARLGRNGNGNGVLVQSGVRIE